MKKSDKETTLFKTDLASNTNQIINKNKTTNVNILLNRVRLDQKKNLRKKIFFFSFLISIISGVVIFAII